MGMGNEDDNHRETLDQNIPVEIPAPSDDEFSV